jgi:hypothetical protein
MLTITRPILSTNTGYRRTRTQPPTLQNYNETTRLIISGDTLYKTSMHNNAVKATGA